jgi:hypothetical protein
LRIGNNDKRKKALEIQQIVVVAWQEELKKRFSKNQLDKLIYEHKYNQL